MNKKRDIRNEVFKKIKREKNRNYIILYSVIIIIFLVLFIYSYTNGLFSGKEFVVDLLQNILGILPPILIFDFFNEKLSKDASAAETSQKITETLMSNPETLDLFSEEQRKTFISSAIASIVNDEDVTAMISSNMKPYLAVNPSLQIRTEFSYSFELSEYLPSVYDDFKDKNKYFYVQERLRYRVRYLSKEVQKKMKDIRIGFVFENKYLDNVLRDINDNGEFDNCIFRESLDITKEDMEYFAGLSKEQLLMKFQSMFKLDVQIDDTQLQISDISVHSMGILVKMKSNVIFGENENFIRIIFHMPKRWGSVLEIAIVDPTKAPKISVSYPEDDMDVDMFSFLTKGKESALAMTHEHKNGIYDIALSNEWVFPISGMVFTVNKLFLEE